MATEKVKIDVEEAKRRLQALKGLDAAARAVHQAAADVVMLEHFLASLGVGVNAAVSTSKSRGGCRGFLKYEKIGKQFRIAVEYWGRTEPYVDAPANEQVLALPYLPELLGEIEKVLRRLVEEAENNRPLVAELCKVLADAKEPQ